MNRRRAALAVGTAVAVFLSIAAAPGNVAPAPPDIGISMEGLTLTALDIDISIFGIDLFHSGTAHAVSSMWDMAIAIGPNSEAFAEGGVGDVATAFSTGSGGAEAVAGDLAVGASGSNFDVASAVGNEADAFAGNPLGITPDTIGSSFDSASALGGGGTLATESVAYAGFNGSGDSASAAGEGVSATAGDSSNAAAPANFDSASVLGNLSAPTTDLTHVIAGSATGLGGSNDTAFVDDPFGTLGSTAIAGEGHMSDLAGSFGDHLNAVATLSDFLSHILPFF